MNFWESKFREVGTMWKFEPSDSAIIALEMFKNNGIKNILIPGFGYGRNAKLFSDAGLTVTGIEISETAIQLARENGLDGMIHHGSVLNMPFDDSKYGGIFCYALLHLFSRAERKKFLCACYNQLTKGGWMIFTVVSPKAEMYGKGTLISKNRFRIMNGLNVYFYDSKAIQREFATFGLNEFRDLEEPIKFMTGHEPLHCMLVICRKP
jgi:SAM-dependent methyltransferase